MHLPPHLDYAQGAAVPEARPFKSSEQALINSDFALTICDEKLLP